ncbi:MAG: hypothetical protein HY832_03615 [Candidatus Aenigmarchaeota archaeon]|nr:hypothetical protein [Candidatus Aenigmarchaeota archaeon]
MPTTIQVSERTRQRLQTLKEREGLKTFDAVIEKMINEELQMPSLFGKATITSWKKTDRMTFHDE